MWKYATIPVLLFFLPYVIWSLLPASFKVRNESGKPVHNLTVAVAGKTFTCGDVPAGGTATGWFYFDHEATLDVRGQLADGTIFEEPCGYIVWEDLAPRVSVVIRDDGSLHVQRSAMFP